MPNRLQPSEAEQSSPAASLPTTFQRVAREDRASKVALSDDATEAPAAVSSAQAPVIYQAVIEQIKTMLREGRYRPGDRLPSERELTERLGVNRNAVREAIRALTLMGVLQTRPQSGSHFSLQLESMLRLPFEFLMLMLRPSYAEIQELRCVLEVYAAGRAAEQRSDADLAQIEAALEELRAMREQYGTGGGPNRRFHRAVAASSHNRLLEYLLFCLLEARSAYILAVSPIGTGRPESIENHERILNAIREGDVEGAREAMRRDMQGADKVGRILHAPAPQE